ncbi:hypothetical protein KDW20_33725 [Burkholderia cenocepacia]|uniref:hypothetical protein n=1 Tax=Burkholderia cenocepacia TaxID=95486 RepID=UPI000F591DDD|nr:hypothetical protein [Burkholderia cenocepacia]MBR8380742.1 hypothetical protein [Burkholderia cenocepacia]RQU63917.1 hypothetical protein DF143_07185 [Burkholderia cenocepacia]
MTDENNSYEQQIQQIRDAQEALGKKLASLQITQQVQLGHLQTQFAVFTMAAVAIIETMDLTALESIRASLRAQLDGLLGLADDLPKAAGHQSGALAQANLFFGAIERRIQALQQPDVGG